MSTQIETRVDNEGGIEEIIVYSDNVTEHIEAVNKLQESLCELVPKKGVK